MRDHYRLFCVAFAKEMMRHKGFDHVDGNGIYRRCIEAAGYYHNRPMNEARRMLKRPEVIEYLTLFGIVVHDEWHVEKDGWHLKVPRSDRQTKRKEREKREEAEDAGEYWSFL